MTRSTSFLRRRIVMAAACSVVLVSQLEGQGGERVMEAHHTPKRYIYPFIGAAIGGAMSLVYFWSGPRTLPGTCAGPTCVAVATLGAGAFVGWLVGREKDELHELRYRGGVPLRPTAMSVDLSGEPMFLIASDSIVAALGAGGVQLVRNAAKPQAMVTRATGLRGISDALIVNDELALTAAGGLYKFPLMAGLGLQLRAAPTAAIGVLGGDYIVAAGTRIERIRRDASDLGASWPGVTLSDTVRAIKVDSRGVIWAVTASELLALRPSMDSLSVISRVPMPKGAQRVDVDGSLAAVALGDSGVKFVNVADPEHPSVITGWTGIRFAHDVALAGGKAFVAAGIDGVARVSLKNGTTPVLEGLMRELGFIVAVEASGQYIWVLDRSGTAILKRFSIKD